MTRSTALRRASTPSRWTFLAALGALAIGCAPGGLADDAGTPADGAPSPDASPVVDAGAPPVDASPVGDASRDAASVDGAPPADDAGLPPPRRLRVVDEDLVDPEGRVVRLRGANFEGATPAEAVDLRRVLRMNFARLRVTFNDDPTVGRVTVDAERRFLPEYLAEVDAWVDALGAEGVWILIEVRSEDHITNSAELYDLSSAMFAQFRRAWLQLAARYRDTDWIAGYGLLAEPSASRADREPVTILTAFQLALMDAITTEAGDTHTPFFVGADYNYDSMQLRYDAYYDALAAYRGRLVYEVNCLAPKPWIQDGTVPDGVPESVGVYPQLPAPDDFTPLVTPLPGERFEVPRDLERIFSRRSEEPEHFPMMMSVEFVRWLLGWALEFRDRHRVPVLIDQFGASVAARGHLEYEADLLALFEDEGLHYARWGYNAGSHDRRLAVGEDPDVRALYRAWGEAHDTL